MPAFAGMTTIMNVIPAQAGTHTYEARYTKSPPTMVARQAIES